MARWTRRPIEQWPGALTPSWERKSSPFSASVGQTMTVMDRELWHLDAENVVLQEAFEEKDLRLDGEPRANAKRIHPGVILSFGSRHGPLQYACDTFTNHNANIRAIALGLEALRRVDRYGITKHGQQYTGWKAIGSGIAMPPPAEAFPSVEAAAKWIAAETRWLPVPSWQSMIDNEDELDAAYRRIAKLVHPDAGGDPDDFKKLTEAKRMIEEYR